jgi:hypothetical protein
MKISFDRNETFCICMTMMLFFIGMYTNFTEFGSKTDLNFWLYNFCDVCYIHNDDGYPPSYKLRELVIFLSFLCEHNTISIRLELSPHEK